MECALFIIMGISGYTIIQFLHFIKKHNVDKTIQRQMESTNIEELEIYLYIYNGIIIKIKIKHRNK